MVATVPAKTHFAVGNKVQDKDGFSKRHDFETNQNEYPVATNLKEPVDVVNKVFAFIIHQEVLGIANKTILAAAIGKGVTDSPVCDRRHGSIHDIPA